MENTNENFLEINNIHNNIYKAIDAFSHLWDASNNATYNQKYFFHIIAAISIAYKELFPEAKITISARFKSFNGFLKNLQKDLLKYFKNELPSSDIFIKYLKGNQTLFNLFKYLSKDYVAIAIRVNNLNTSFISSDNLKKLDQELLRKLELLLQTSESNHQFIEQMQSFINNRSMNYSNVFSIKLSEKNFLENYIDLLCRLINTIYPEFEDEIEPYFCKLKYIKKIYKSKLNSENEFSMEVNSNEIAEFKNYLDELENRQNDKLQFAFLEASLPIVFEHPLLKCLLTQFEFYKEVKSTDGFSAIFYIGNCPSINYFEIQGQSDYRYIISKIGDDYHHKNSEKALNIFEFFEFAYSSSCSYSIDLLNNVLNYLNNTSYDVYIRAKNKNPDSELVTKVDKYFRAIKLKETFSISGEKPINIPIFQYILMVVEAHCSDNYKCEQPPVATYSTITHTTFNETVKSLLCQRDGLSCLSHFLIENFQEYLKEINYKRNTIYDLPQFEITKRDIIEFSKSLRTDKSKNEIDESKTQENIQEL